MMNWIVRWSMNFRLLVIALTVVMIYVGVTQLRNMPVDALPEFAPPYVEVQTEALGLSATEVEELVTLNLEELLNGTPFLQSIHSRSVTGLSSITLFFQPGTDVLLARQLVSERLGLAFALPNVSKAPVILQPLSATSRVMMVGFSSKEVPLITMSVLARWDVRPALLSVPGVANVSIWGMRDRQLQVLVDPQKLKDNNVTLEQVVSTTGNALWISQLSFLNASAPSSGGWIDSPTQRLEVRHVLPISSPEDLAKVNVEGTQLLLGDVATVVEDHQPLIGDNLLKDGTGLIFVIEKFPSANTLEVTRGVEAKLQELQPALSGIQIDSSVFRPASFIELGANNLTRDLIIGAILLLAVLLVFLFHWRLTLISLVAIPLSLLAGGLVLYLRGATINMMVLAGAVIALGVIIDDAVIDVENVARRLREHRRDEGTRPAMDIIIEATLETRSAMVYGALVILLALLPIFMLEGLSGSFFQPVALTYALALLASMVVALTITPVLCLILLSRTPLERYESPVLRGIQRVYGALLRGVVRIPGVAFLIVCALALVSVGVLPFLGEPLLGRSLVNGSILPTFKEPNVLVTLQGAPGTSYPEMTRITTRISNEVRGLSGVNNVGVIIGRAVLGDQVVDVDSAQMAIKIDPAANYDTTLASIEKTVRGYPGLSYSVKTYLNQKIDEVLVGAKGDIVVRIFGPNLETLRSSAEQVKQAISKIEGAANVQTELQVDIPHVQIKVDLAKAQRFGLKPGDVRRAASTLVAGIEAGSLFEEQKVFEVVVWGAPQTRQSVSSIRNLLIDTPSGEQVRLGDVADVTILPTPNVIQHETISRRIDVSLDVRGRDPGAVVNAVKESLQNIKFPLEYRAVVLGAYEDQQAAQSRLLLFGTIAAIGIFLLLQAAFASWRLAALSFFALSIAMLGGVLAMFVDGGAFSLVSLIGLLAVGGIALRNSIMLVQHYQHLERHEGLSFGPELVLRGTCERLGPILITALAMTLILVPLVVTGNIAGHEVLYPIAVVILGGLIGSTVLNLFILPPLYLRYGTSVKARERLEKESAAVPAEA